MELLEFIINDVPLTNSKFVTKNFVIKYKQQNNEILNLDILKFIRLYNGKSELCENCNDKIFKKYNTTYLIEFSTHTILLYKNNKGEIEKYDINNFDKKNKVQYSTNNCSLYMGIIGVIRPFVKDMKNMLQILNMVSDEPGTKSCDKLAEISKHYFGRGIEYFVY